jgi:hypothetical protein
MNRAGAKSPCSIFPGWGSAPVPARGCEPLLPHHFPHHAAALRPLASAIRVQSYFLTK